MKHTRKVLCTFAFVLSPLAAACHRAATGATTAPQLQRVAAASAANGTPPPFLLGKFEDDYQGSYTISATEFVQGARAHFHIVQWHTPDQYFIAQNDAKNSVDANKWTRIDWMVLSGMTPFEWAFCFTAYNAATRAAAESTPAANRTNPRAGCNKFPFSRMRPMSP
jgi:hypothetical protein